MDKANPKAWFPMPGMAKISHKKVGKWEERNQKYRPYFNTWDEAHRYQLLEISGKLDRAIRETASYKRTLTTLINMHNPETP